MDKAQREQGIYKVTIIGTIVNLVLTIGKFIAGVLGNSSAMLADAIHSLSDLITDFIVIFFVRIANKPEDHCHDYGHGKFETLATLLIGGFLLLVGVGIAWDGISNIMLVVHGGVLPKPGMVALVAAIASIILKEVLYHYTVIRGRKLDSPAVVANAWHHRSDALSSVATLLGIGGAILLGHHWTVLDPAAAFVVSFFIMYAGVAMMKPCVDELMEKALPDEVKIEILSIVQSVPDVSHLHHLRTRKIGNNYAIEFHIRMDGTMSLDQAHGVVGEVERKLREKFGQDTYITIHMEPLLDQW